MVAPATSSPLPLYMASQRSLTLSPLIPIVKEILNDLVGPLKIVVNVLDSGPLVNVSLVSLKSLPYAAYGNQEIVKQFDNGVSCRLRYFEAVVTSLAAVIYNVVFGLVFSVVSFVTLGQVKLMIDQMNKHWLHSALAIAALGVSCAGTISPQLGVRANLAAGMVIGFGLVCWTQSDIVSKICVVYQRRQREIKGAVAEGCLRSGIDFEREFTPFFNYLDANLNNRVWTFSEIGDVIRNAISRFPHHVIPLVTPEGIVVNLQTAH